MNRYYPAFLDLKDRRCVVVGGGAVATRKVQALIEAQARVTVIAPQLSAELQPLVGAGAVEHATRAYEPGDLAGAFLAIAATDDAAANARVAREARARGVLVNAVDDLPNCDFIAPAIVKRGDLVVAISTAGKSPAFARRLREELEQLLSDDYLALLDLLGEVRTELRRQGIVRSGEVWHQAVDQEVLDCFRRGERQAARRRLVERLRASAPRAAS
ncbi:MAG: bifunctional precorrin-2 dehydrogenase/sirohydrochlorin ferrochelatase [Chloroflexi bacterium]|nr:bifunctional precorrin-2 dehydrogenase/sirohydrochlorin ferrochelatase [Chloroflexota bacterium]